MINKETVLSKPFGKLPQRPRIDGIIDFDIVQRVFCCVDPLKNLDDLFLRYGTQVSYRYIILQKVTLFVLRQIFIMGYRSYHELRVSIKILNHCANSL